MTDERGPVSVTFLYRSWLDYINLTFCIVHIHMIVFFFRCWIDHCYHRLRHWDDLQAMHDPQGNLHRGGTCVSEVQIIAILDLCDT